MQGACKNENIKLINLAIFLFIFDNTIKECISFRIGTLTTKIKFLFKNNLSPKDESIFNSDWDAHKVLLKITKLYYFIEV